MHQSRCNTSMRFIISLEILGINWLFDDTLVYRDVAAELYVKQTDWFLLLGGAGMVEG